MKLTVSTASCVFLQHGGLVFRRRVKYATKVQQTWGIMYDKYFLNPTVSFACVYVHNKKNELYIDCTASAIVDEQIARVFTRVSSGCKVVSVS